MKRILAIGNSFSQDATAYLHDLAAAAGEECMVLNLYIGGCSLQRHWENVEGDLPDYEYEQNGVSTGEKGSVRTALLRQSWDEVTLQQVSGKSGEIESYEPYLGRLIATVRQFAPDARLWLHETWAYECDSSHEDFIRYDHSQKKMYQSICDAYAHYAKHYGLPVLPAGEVIQRLRETPEFCYTSGGASLCRDGFHLELVYGRYAAAAVWFECMFGKSVEGVPFLPDAQVPPEPEKLSLIQKTVHMVCGVAK